MFSIIVLWIIFLFHENRSIVFEYQRCFQKLLNHAIKTCILDLLI